MWWIFWSTIIIILVHNIQPVYGWILSLPLCLSNKHVQSSSSSSLVLSSSSFNDNDKGIPLEQSISTSTSSTSTAIQKDLMKGVIIMDHIMNMEYWNTKTKTSSSAFHVLQSQCMKRIEIKPSTIPNAGLGLFAKTNIKSGTIISFYPVHALGMDHDPNNNNNNNKNDQGFFVSLPQDMEYFQNHPCTQSNFLHCTDQPLFQRKSILSTTTTTTTTIPLYLDVNPYRMDRMNNKSSPWISHMINDGARIQSNTEKGILQYYDESKQNKNCIHIPWGPSPILATVTTKKVKKGEEFFTTYGSTYWLGALLQNDNNDVQQQQQQEQQQQPDGSSSGSSIPTIITTPEIQQKIQQTALDLVNSMKTVATTYESQETSLKLEFDKLKQSLFAEEEEEEEAQ